ncbi:hypothetical protein RSAG8_13125, partial [Rhizoctonia solani AG-8 WAC10335]
MGDPLLLFRLSEHLFNAQMAKYRSRYLRAVFPENTTYTPPTLPAHASVNLEPVTGVPSDEAIIKVQDTIREYQQFSNVPSMFDPRVNMDLSQHLFDLQMARYTRLADERQPIPQPPETVRSTFPAQIIERAAEVEETVPATNNAGTGANTTIPEQIPQSTPVVDTRELFERSNQLFERFNQLVEHSNEIAARPVQPTEQSNCLAERFNQVLERISQLMEQACRPTEQSNQPAGRFNELFGRFNELAEQSNRPSSAADYQRAALKFQPTERLGDILRNINRVLVGIQHAIIRNNRGNTLRALDCLMNDRGEIPRTIFNLFTERYADRIHHLPVVINGVYQLPSVPDSALGLLLCFFGVEGNLCEDRVDYKLKAGKEREARDQLSRYLTSCLG